MITPASFCTSDPIFLLLFNIMPLAPKYQIRKIINKSGSEVTITNTEGNTNPYDVSNTTGIKVSINNTNIVGQNANVKLAPIKKLPRYLSLNLVGILNIFPVFLQLNKPIINKPTSISNGPIAFLRIGNICVKVLCISFPSNQITKPIIEKTTILPKTNRNMCNQGTFSTNDLFP